MDSESQCFGDGRRRYSPLSHLPAASPWHCFGVRGEMTCPWRSTKLYTFQNGYPPFSQAHPHTLRPSAAWALKVRILSSAPSPHLLKVTYGHYSHPSKSPPNIVPFISVTTNPLQVALEWVWNGNLTESIERNPGANRIGLVSLL